jgi:hypothetical protein
LLFGAIWDAWGAERALPLGAAIAAVATLAMFVLFRRKRDLDQV